MLELRIIPNVCSEYSEQHFRDCQRRISKAPTLSLNLNIFSYLHMGWQFGASSGAQQGSNPVFYRADYQLFNHYLQSWSPVWTPHFPRDENIPIMQAFAGICKLVIFLCLK